MKEELFTNLPTEMVIDILSRLPTRSIIVCKIVCKSWRESVESLEFAKSHLSKAAPHLVSFLGVDRPIPYKMVEFVAEHRSAHRCNVVSNMSFPHVGEILGSVNGLLFWCNGGKCSRDIFVCNPITREYMELPPPPKLGCYITAGVGVSQKSGQYKIVRILRNSRFIKCEFQLHTVGSGSWRRFLTSTKLWYSSTSVGAFLNGNLYWLAYSGTKICVCRFDLETERLTTYCYPTWFEHNIYKTLSVVGGRLCLCASADSATEIWFMNEYGHEKSWTKEFFIAEDLSRGILGGRNFFPIKVFIKGDQTLTASEDCNEVLRCLKATKGVHATGIPKHDRCVLFAMRSVVITPTFLSLKTLLNVTENVLKF